MEQFGKLKKRCLDFLRAGGTRHSQHTEVVLGGLKLAEPLLDRVGELLLVAAGRDRLGWLGSSRGGRRRLRRGGGGPPRGWVQPPPVFPSPPCPRACPAPLLSSGGPEK